MARKKKTQQDYQDMLPIGRKYSGTNYGYITGFVTVNVWGISIKECCQDPLNWRGEGKVKDLTDKDPWYTSGARYYRDCICSTCGEPVIGTEYLKSKECIDTDGILVYHSGKIV